MTTVVTALNRIARQVSVSTPSSWVTATADEHVEIRDDFLKETVADIAARVDLPYPMSDTRTYAGSGDTTYSLPDHFVRLQSGDLAVYDVAQQRGCVQIGSIGEWTDIATRGVTGSVKYFRITGYHQEFSIEFLEALTSEVVVSYVSEVWKVSSAGVNGFTFSDEDDVLLMPREVVEAGVVWRWRERKGLPFDAKYAEYEALIAKLSNRSRGMRAVNMGERKTARWQDMIPAYIPAS